MTKLPKDATPAEVHAWFKAQEHRTLATAARRRAHYDTEEAGVAEYHDAEVARLEAELAAGRGRKKRKNPAPDSEAFRRWFGDSKVVDDNGEPLVVWHAHPRGKDPFYVFDFFFAVDLGMHFGTKEAAEQAPAPFDRRFDDDDDEADDDEADDDEADRVRPFYLSMKNPLVMPDLMDWISCDSFGANFRRIPTLDSLFDMGVITSDEYEDAKDEVETVTQKGFSRREPDISDIRRDISKIVRDLILRSGFDGICYTNEVESKGSRSWIALYPEQIKLADGTNTTFDPDTDDIRKNPPHRRRNPTRAAYAHDDAQADEVDDWVTIEECGCHACAPARMNPRAAKRTATGAYADLDSVTLVITNALANYGLSMNNILAVKFTRGGKSRGGACSYSRSLNKCQIMFNGLAWPAFTEEQRLNTVLHEAAHAIQFLTTGTSDHGPKWQKIARSIGCSGDSCMTLEASQAMVDAYAEAKGLEKRKIITREDAEAARADFAVGDHVSFDHKRERWFGKIVSRGPMHATVMIQSPREGITGKIPYPSLQKEAPPRFAEKVAGVDKPAPGESLSAWQARTGRGARS